MRVTQTSGDNRNQKQNGCVPKQIRESEEILRVEEELKRGRKGEIVGRWCRRLEGDRGQSFNTTKE